MLFLPLLFGSYRVSLINEPSQMIASDRIMLMKPEGLSIVSDIDDTIKVSQVASIRSLLTNTFSSNYRSVEVILFFSL